MHSIPTAYLLLTKVSSLSQVFADEVDILLTPTMHNTAPPTSLYLQEDNLTRIHEYDTYTQGVNLAGLTRVQLHIFFDSFDFLAIFSFYFVNEYYTTCLQCDFFLYLSLKSLPQILKSRGASDQRSRGLL